MLMGAASCPHAPVVSSRAVNSLNPGIPRNPG